MLAFFLLVQLFIKKITFINDSRETLLHIKMLKVIDKLRFSNQYIPLDLSIKMKLLRNTNVIMP
jgi:hypothetical protein